MRAGFMCAVGGSAGRPCRPPAIRFALCPQPHYYSGKNLLMWLFIAMVVCGSMLITVWYYWRPFFEDAAVFKQSDFTGWAIKGLAMPTIFWILINSGAMNWIDLIVDYVGRGMIVLTSWWMALSLIWIVGVLIKNIPEENRVDFKTHLIFWSFIMVPVGILIAFLGGWMAGGFAASVWLLPIAHYATPLLVKPKKTAFYSAAIGRMKMGKFDEAEAEILRQLEECRDDFDGWLMLAELYAVHFHDLDTADQTIRDLCLQPDLNPGQVYTALTRLADWHLTLGDDPIAARTALEIVCKAYPGTHLGRLAQGKLSNLSRPP